MDDAQLLTASTGAAGAPAHNVQQDTGRPYRPWTTVEVAILREHFPVGGVAACRPHLGAHRTWAAIWQKAHLMRLPKPPKRHPSTHQHWESSEAIDRAIERTYQRAMRRGDVSRLAERIGRPPWWTKERAAKLGLVQPLGNQPWTDAEDELLARHAHRDPRSIAKALRTAGYSRSVSAIVVRRKRQGLRPADNGYHTGRQVAFLLGVEERTVRRWIEGGLLRAKRRGTQRTEVQGGDQYWINERDIRAFCAAHPSNINLCCVDKYWFVAMLIGDGQKVLL